MFRGLWKEPKRGYSKLNKVIGMAGKCRGVNLSLLFARPYQNKVFRLYMECTYLLYRIQSAQNRKGGIAMRVITYHTEPISRGKGRSAVQIAAYCGREKLYSNYAKRSFTTDKKHDLLYSKILLPDYAPKDFLDRETLWNSVEFIEKNINSRLARSFYYSLPRGFDLETYICMVENYVQEYFVDRGMCADVFIHDKGTGNPHVHTIVTTRPLDENGFWLNKEKAVYLMNPDGTKFRDPETNKYIRMGTEKLTDWDKGENVEVWRRGWAETCNRELERKGLERVTHMSYARQGIDIKPTKYKGRKVIELEKRGIMTDRSNENRAIEDYNKELNERKQQRQITHSHSYERSL